MCDIVSRDVRKAQAAYFCGTCVVSGLCCTCDPCGVLSAVKRMDVEPRAAHVAWCAPALRVVRVCAVVDGSLGVSVVCEHVYLL